MKPSSEQGELLPVELPRGNRQTVENGNTLQRWIRAGTLGIAMVLGSAGGEVAGPMQAIGQETGQDGKTEADRAKDFRNAVATNITTMRAKYAVLPVQKILEGAEGERDPVVRAALFGVAVQQAALAGDTMTMNAALARMLDAGEKSGFTSQDVFAFKVETLRRIGTSPQTLRSMEGTQRMALAREICSFCIPQAYKEENLPLAKELRELAQMKYLSNVTSSSFPANGRMENYRASQQLRKELGNELMRQNQLQRLYDVHTQGLDAEGNPKSPLAHYSTAIWKISIGRWNEAVEHLAQCDNPPLAKAAKLDAAMPQTAEERLACAQAWIGAAGGDLINGKQWCERAATHLYQAQQLKPTGETGLDVATAVALLKRRGIEVGPGEQETAAQEAFPKGKWVDVNPSLIDFQKDELLRGKWTRQNNVITQTQVDQTARLAIPLIVKSKNYSCKLTMRRANNIPRDDGAIFLSMPLDGNATVRIDIDHVNRLIMQGKDTNTPLVSIPYDLTNNAVHTVEISVHNQHTSVSVQLKIDGQIVINHTGKLDEYGHEPALPSTRIILGCRTPVEFAKIQIQNSDDGQSVITNARN